MESEEKEEEERGREEEVGVHGGIPFNKAFSRKSRESCIPSSSGCKHIGTHSDVHSHKQSKETHSLKHSLLALALVCSGKF